MLYENKLQNGDIIITYNKKSFISKAIGYFVSRLGKVSDYRACHSQLYLFDGIIIESSVGGVKVRKLKGYNPKSFRLYIARYKHMSPELLEKLTQASIKHLGEKYAYLQLIVIMFKYIFKMKNTCDVSRKALVCSELICQLFKDSGVDLFNQECHEIAPAHFLEHEDIESERIF